MSQTMGLGNLSIEFTIYLSAFLFPREVLDGIEDMHMADILFRWFTSDIREKVKIISQSIVRFSINKLEKLLDNLDIVNLLDYYLKNGAVDFFTDEFYSDIWYQLKVKVENTLKENNSMHQNSSTHMLSNFPLPNTHSY